MSGSVCRYFWQHYSSTKSELFQYIRMPDLWQQKIDIIKTIRDDDNLKRTESFFIIWL